MENLPPFYVGQRVVCLEEFKHYKTNVVYVVAVVHLTKCCKKWIVGCVGMYCDPTTKFKCTCGVPPYFDNIPYYVLWSKYFVPIQENFQSISYEKVMEEELISVN